MYLTGLLQLLNRLPPFRQLLENGSETPLALLQAARPFITAGLRNERASTVMLLTARSEMVQQIVTQLQLWLPAQDEGGPAILTFPEADALPYERIGWSSATRQQRITALAALQSRSVTPPIVVASARALM